MHDLNKAVSECEKILNDLAIPYRKPEAITVSGRMKKTLGKCLKQKNGFEVRLSSRVMDDQSNEKALLTTLVHEYLHTCPGCFDHGNLWQLYARRINLHTSLEISRLADENALGLARIEGNQARKSYCLECVDCHMVIYRQRKSQSILHPQNYRCPKCRGRLHSYWIQDENTRHLIR